jgi:hypothetical protein
LLVIWPVILAVWIKNGLSKKIFTLSLPLAPILQMSNSYDVSLASLSHDDFCVFLDWLKPLLDNLPWQLPIKSAADSAFTSFLDFQIDPELLERTGCEVSALSEQLKRVFGWQARTTGDGIITIDERGPAVCALHKVLGNFWEHYSENGVLQKWIFDIVKGAEKAYHIHNEAVCYLQCTFESNCKPKKCPTISTSGNLASAGQKQDRSESIVVKNPSTKTCKMTSPVEASESVCTQCMSFIDG